MSWRHLMFSVTCPARVGPMEMGKVGRLASGLGAELELFRCIFDPHITRAGGFETRGAQEDIHEFVDRRRKQCPGCVLGKSVVFLRRRAHSLRAALSVQMPMTGGLRSALAMFHDL
jgi:hypothetical protein